MGWGLDKGYRHFVTHLNKSNYHIFRSEVQSQSSTPPQNITTLSPSQFASREALLVPHASWETQTHIKLRQQTGRFFELNIFIYFYSNFVFGQDIFGAVYIAGLRVTSTLWIPFFYWPIHSSKWRNDRPIRALYLNNYSNL